MIEQISNLSPSFNIFFDYRLFNENKFCQKHNEFSYLYDKNRVLQENHNLNKAFKYTCDDMGRISCIKNINDETLHAYSYDLLSRLISDNDSSFAYDNNGNIISITNNSTGSIKNYYYHSIIKDQLLTIKDENNNTLYSVTYSGLYPVSIFKQGLLYNLSWSGDKLININNNIEYSYNDSGLRVKKIINGLSTKYVYEQNKIVNIKKQTSSNEYIKFNFLYNVDGQLSILQFNGKIYYYIHDALGNIISILRSNKTEIAKFEYNTYGTFTITPMSSLSNDEQIVITNNPFYFKDYYYDDETGLYWLSSRYYDPEIGRFISPDSVDYLDPTSINGLNLYAYCNNDPVNYCDPSGHIAITTAIILGLIGIGALVGFGAVAYMDYSDDGEIFNGSIGWETYVGGTLLGGAIGGTIGYFVGPSIAGLLASSGYIGGGLAFAGVGGSIGGAIAISSIGELTLVGAGVLTGAVSFGATVMFAKGGLPNNKYHNHQWAEAMRRLGIENKDLWRRLHNEIQKYPYNTHDDLKKLIKLIIEILKKGVFNNEKTKGK